MSTLSYKDFVQKVRYYKQSTVIQFSSFLGWLSWENVKELKEMKDFGKELYLYRAHAGRIAAISAATGNEDRTKRASIEDIKMLCHSYLYITEPLVKDEAFEEMDVLRLEKALENSEVFKPFRQNKDIVRFCAGMLTPTRTLQLQHESYEASDSLHVIARNYALLTRFLEKCEKSFRDQYFARLGIEPEYLFMIGLFFISAAQKSRGLIVLDNNFLPPELKSRSGIDFEAIELIARRFSRDFKGFREWHDEALKTNHLLTKYVANPLIESPLIQIEKNKYAIPSPWFLLEKIKFYFWEPITRQDELEKLKIVGKVFKEYFEDAIKVICPDLTLSDLDSLKCLRKTLRADFLLYKDNKCLIVELKKTFGSYGKMALAEPEEVVLNWERLTSGIAQCGSTLRHISDVEKELGLKFDKVATIVCGVEELGSVGAFYVYCFNSGLLNSLGVEDFELISIDQLECLLMDVGFDLFFEALFVKQSSEQGRDVTLRTSIRKMIYKNRKPKSSAEMPWKHLEEFVNKVSYLKN